MDAFGLLVSIKKTRNSTAMDKTLTIKLNKHLDWEEKIKMGE